MTNFFRSVKLYLPVCWLVLSVSLWAQSNPGSPSRTTLRMEDKELTDQEIKGEGLFMSHCGLCHLPKRTENKGTVSGRSFGQSLDRLLRDKPGKEKTVREIILNGTAKGPAIRCPGFQYALEPEEIDNLMAYLKTL